MAASFLAILLLEPHWRKWRLRAALLMYAAILALGSVPGARADIGLVASGVVLHSLAYGLLTLLLFGGTSGTPAARVAKAVACIMAMGAGDEFLQSFLPYRHADVHDWIVDVSAALVVSALLLAFSRRSVSRT